MEKPKRLRRQTYIDSKGGEVFRDHVWQLFGPFDFFTMQYGCEQFEEQGWTIENTFMSQVIAKPASNVLQLNKQAPPQIQNVGYALCSKWMTDDEYKKHLEFIKPKNDMEDAKSGKIIT